MGKFVARVRRSLVRRYEQLRAGKARRHMLVADSWEFEASRKFQIDFLRSQGLQPDQNLIEVGCGTLRGGIPLIELLEPGRYCGIDVRSAVIEEARNELREEGLEWKQPELILCEDLSNLARDRVDVIWSFEVMIHMSDPILEVCMDFVSRHLAPGGRFYGSLNVGPECQVGAWDIFPVMIHPMAFYEELAERHGLRCEDLGTLVGLGEPGGQRLPDEQKRMLVWRLAESD